MMMEIQGASDKTRFSVTEQDPKLKLLETLSRFNIYHYTATNKAIAIQHGGSAHLLFFVAANEIITIDGQGWFFAEKTDHYTISVYPDKIGYYTVGIISA